MKWGLALRGGNNNKHSLCKSGSGWDGRPAGGQVHKTTGTGAAVAVTAPCRAAVFTHAARWRRVPGEATRGIFPSDRQFSLSLSLSFSWMAVKRNAKDAEADFFFFSSPKTQGSNCGSTQGQQQQRPYWWSSRRTGDDVDGGDFFLLLLLLLGLRSCVGPARRTLAGRSTLRHFLHRREQHHVPSQPSCSDIFSFCLLDFSSLNFPSRERRGDDVPPTTSPPSISLFSQKLGRVARGRTHTRATQRTSTRSHQCPYLHLVVSFSPFLLHSFPGPTQRRGRKKIKGQEGDKLRMGGGRLPA